MLKKGILVLVFLAVLLLLVGCGGPGNGTPPTNEVVYRALLIGVGDYMYDATDLPSPPYDVDRMIQILNQSQLEFSTIWYLKNQEATRSKILQRIATTFSGANGNDVSYFYYAGHGARNKSTSTSYLLPTDYNGYTNTAISVSQLESALSAIPGTKVVFLDTCHSGGFIGKEKIISEEELESFNDEVISIFSQNEYKTLLTSNEYKVLTACRKDQYGWEISSPTDSFDPYGLFTKALVEGCGYYGNYPADANNNAQVSLQEAYKYIKSWVATWIAEHNFPQIKQVVQVYPNDSAYPVVEY